LNDKPIRADGAFVLCWMTAHRRIGWNSALDRALAKHARDRRPVLYTARQLECAETRDPLWNAGQRQLVREGRLHNYIRMLGGKKILEWSRRPEGALNVMLALNNKYALDGRDPSSAPCAT
jgi:deoxyribodipyrimidine photo-lyase